MVYQCLKKRKKWLNTIIFSIYYDAPIVMFDRTADGIECDKVIVDDFDSHLKFYAINRFGM
jgi:hypothetical protein